MDKTDSFRFLAPLFSFVPPVPGTFVPHPRRIQGDSRMAERSPPERGHGGPTFWRTRLPHGHSQRARGELGDLVRPDVAGVPDADPVVRAHVLRTGGQPRAVYAVAPAQGR